MQFTAALRAELDDPNPTNLDGWIFPAAQEWAIAFNDRTIQKSLSLRGAVFEGNVYFKSVMLLEHVNLEGAQFNGEVDFAGVDLGNTGTSIKFNQATFVGPVNFRQTKFFGETLFQRCVFNDEVNLDEATECHAAVSFNKTVFKGQASFSKSLFKETAEFDEAQFEKVAEFKTTRFHGQATFEQTVFSEFVDFSEAQFKQLASFRAAHFARRAKFEATQFLLSNARVNFDNAICKGSVSFEKTKFYRDSDFFMTEFAQEVKFDNAEFTGKAKFEKTTFNEVHFTDVKFRGPTKFDRPRFSNAEFLRTEFCGDIAFDRPQFSGGITVLDSVSFCRTANLNVQVSARNLLAIRNTDLASTRFSNSNVENVDFENVRWQSTKHYRWKIADEPSVGTFSRVDTELAKQLEEARGLYRQLRLNYDKAGEYEIAGRFYVSESEMAYLSHFPVYRWIHPRGLYKWASKYGQSILQAAVILLVLVFVFALIYWGLSRLRPLWFQETPKMLGTNFPGQLSGAEAVWLSLQASKPLADVGLSPRTIMYWLVLAQGFIVPTQIALFLLAMRRRFRRGD